MVYHVQAFTMVEIGLALLSIICLYWAMATHPSRGGCPMPRSMFISSTARDGAYTCQRSPTDDLDDNHGGTLPRGEFHGRIYCTNGTMPIEDFNGRTVGCQTGGWQQELPADQAR